MLTVAPSIPLNRDHPRVAAVLERLSADFRVRQAVDTFFLWAGDRDLDGITREDVEGWRDQLSDTEDVISQWLVALRHFYDQLRRAGLVRRNPVSELIGARYYDPPAQKAPPFTRQEVRLMIEPPRRRAGIRELRDFLICGVSLAVGDRAEELAKTTIESIEKTTMPLELTRQLRRYLKLYRPRAADIFLFPRIRRSHRNLPIDGSLAMSPEGIRQAMRRHAKARKVEEQSIPGVKKPSAADRFIATHYVYFHDFHGGRYKREVLSVAASTLVL